MTDENYGTEVSIEELKGHYETNFMTSDQFIDLVMEWHKSEVKKLTIPFVGSSLPDLAECNQASLDYATKKDNPDFFLIKQTFKEGINWALNYVKERI